MDKVIIIAEAGVNHNGDIKIAKSLIDVAAAAGVDYIKFQTFKADNLVTKEARKAAYQISNNPDVDNSQYAMLKSLELSDHDHLELMDYCKSKKVWFFSTAFDTDGLDYLNSLEFKEFKVPSGEITNFPYLKKLAGFKKPVILSTGMADIAEIGQALEVLMSEGLTKDKITVLHCNTEYPTPMVDVNLKAMNTIAQEYNVKVGYSDHTLGIEVPIAAVALGATIIEKHFTLDRNRPGPDHRASLEPQELKAMVQAIRNIELAFSGSGKKEPSKSELKNKAVARKSIHTKRALQKGQVISEKDIIPLRPGTGISPMFWESILGKKVSRDLPENYLISFSDLKD